MASLPVEILLGLYLGLLVGILPALVSWGLAFTFKYFTGVTLPGFGVVVLSIALAGVNGGLLALADRSIIAAPNAERVLTAILVVAMISLYAHAKGDQMGVTFPKRLSLAGIRDRTLSADLAEFVAGRNQVKLRVVGDVGDMQGYPPLPADIRAAIRGSEWTFSADLRVTDLESRLADRLRSEFDLGDVSVTVDERGRATVVAAPPFSGLSKRIEPGLHAVSVDALLPTGLARGDRVRLSTSEGDVEGTVLSARTDADDATDPANSSPAPEGGVGPPVDHSTVAPTTDGGEGRLTVAVRPENAAAVLGADQVSVVVDATGSGREYELVSLFRRAGHRVRRVSLAAGADLVGTTLDREGLRDRFGVGVLAHRTAGGWTLDPGPAELSAGDELYVVGPRDAVAAFLEVTG